MMKKVTKYQYEEGYGSPLEMGSVALCDDCSEWVHSVDIHEIESPTLSRVRAYYRGPVGGSRPGRCYRCGEGRSDG